MNLFGLYWGAVSIALPVFIKLGGPHPVRYSKDFFFGFAVILSLVLFGMKKHKNLALYLTSGFFIIVGFINQYSFASVGVQFQFHMMCAGIVLLNQMVGNTTKEDIIYIKRGLAVSCIIQCALVCISFLGVDLYRLSLEYIFNARTLDNDLRPFTAVLKGLGSLGNKGIAGAFIASTLPFLFNGKFKCFIPLCLCGLILTDSAIPILATGCGLIVYFYTRVLRRRYFYHLLTLSAIGVALIAHASTNAGFFSASGRLETWHKAIVFLGKKDFLFGKGLGFVHDKYQLFSQDGLKMLQLHNEYLEILLAFGVLGVFMCIWFFMINKNRILTNDTHFLISLAITAGVSVGWFNLHITSTALVGIMALAILIRGKSCHELGTIRL